MCSLRHVASSPSEWPRKFLPKTICSSDYRAGCSHKLVSTVCIIDCENSLCNKWGEQIFGIFGPNFQFGVCRSAPSLLGYLFNIFPRGSLSIRRRTTVASAQPALNRDCGVVQRKRQLRNISKRSIWISAKYLDISQVSGFAYLHFLAMAQKNFDPKQRQATSHTWNLSRECKYFGLG